MSKTMALLALVPLLTAAVRLQDATPEGLQNLSASPAPQSYSLPPAAALVTPTVIRVSPTVMPWVNVPPVSPSAVARPQPANPAAMPQVVAQVCARGLATTADIALQSYRLRPQKAVSTLVIATAMAASAADAATWPNLNAFTTALNSLPYTTPLRGQIRTAGTATRTLCANPNAPAPKPIPGSRIPIPRPD